MGPSGCGKTTCLDVLAGRRHTGVQGGKVFVNGRDRAEQSVKNAFDANCGYMLQLAETFESELTVRENLAYAAELRLPASKSFDEKMKRVDEVILELNMVPIMDVKVGSATGGGISGGQKRKLMLATEMLAQPAVLFLDEPTSGLDSTSALEVMGSMRRYCATGRSIAVTIHQPRTEIFAAFDKLLLLYRGQVAFFGPPLKGAIFLEETATNLADEDAGLVAGPDTNKADIVLDILNYEAGTQSKRAAYGIMDHANDLPPRTSARVSRMRKSIKQAAKKGAVAAATSPRPWGKALGKVKMIASLGSNRSSEDSPMSKRESLVKVHATNIGEFATALYRVSGIADSISKSIDACVGEAKTLKLPVVDEAAVERTGCCGGMLQWWTKLKALQSRQLMKTSLLSYFAAHVQFLILGGIFSSLFYRATEIYIVTGILVNMASFPSALIMCPVISIFSANLAKGFQFEVNAGVVSPMQFLLQHVVHFELWMLTGLLPFLILTYCSVFEPISTVDLLYTMAFRTFDCQVFLALFLAICSLFFLLGSRDPQVSLVAAATLHALFAFFSGFFISLEDTPVYWKWVNHISPRFHSVSVTFRINLQGYNSKDCLDGSISSPTELSQCIAAASGDSVLRRLSYGELDVNQNMVVLISMWAGLNLAAALILIYAHSTWSFVDLVCGKQKPPVSVDAHHKEEKALSSLLGLDNDSDESKAFKRDFIENAELHMSKAAVVFNVAVSRLERDSSIDSAAHSADSNREETMINLEEIIRRQAKMKRHLEVRHSHVRYSHAVAGSGESSPAVNVGHSPPPPPCDTPPPPSSPRIVKFTPVSSHDVQMSVP